MYSWVMKMANITRLESTAARKTLRLRKLDFHIVKNIRIKIYTKEKKSRRTKLRRADTSSHPRKGDKDESRIFIYSFFFYTTTFYLRLQHYVQFEIKFKVP